MAVAFDASYYLLNNRDVAIAVGNGLFPDAYSHFIQFGAAEMRNPNADFNAQDYAALNPDVVAAVSAGYFTSVWDHYVRFGLSENRAPNAGLAGFDAAGYLALHGDVAAAVAAGIFKSAMEHYLAHGQSEGRSWGNEQQLTNGTDILSGNKFVAGLAYTPGGTDRINTLQDEDELTGIGANPTLTATLGNANDNGGSTITPKLTGIQTLALAFTGSGANAVTTLDLQDATGLQEIGVSRISTAASYQLANLTEASTSRFVLENIHVPATVDFRFVDGVLAGGADAASLTLKGVTMDLVTIQTKSSLHGFETLTISSQSGDNSLSQLQAAQLQNLIITGDQDLSLLDLTSNGDGARLFGPAALVNSAADGAVLRSIDASGLSGRLTIDLTGHTHRQIVTAESGKLVDLVVTGGSGNDSFIINEAVTDAALQIRGGDGIDTLVLTRSLTDNPATKDATTAITGVERLDLISNTGTRVEVDTNLIGDLREITLRNEIAGDAIFDLDGLSAVAAGAITIQHGVTGGNSLLRNVIQAELADASGNADVISITIADGLNSDPSFNFQLETSAVVPVGQSPVAHVIEQVTLNDRDTESNAVRLLNPVATIVLQGGSAGQYFDLDSNNLYQRDLSGGLSTATGVVGGIGAGVRGDGLTSARIDATDYVGDVTVRLGGNTASLSGAQTVVMGSGNDTVIFDETGSSTAGLGSSDSVSGGAGSDSLVLHGDTTITIGVSEWAGVSGFETIRVVGNGVASNNGPGLVNAYNLILTPGLLESNGTSANGIRSIAIINDNGTAAADESGITVDARPLTGSQSFSYKGEAGFGIDNGGATADRFIVSDANLNGQLVIDGGDEHAGRSRNSDVLEIRNSAVVSTGDLSNISNIGFIELRSDQAIAQSYTLQLDNSTLDRFDSSQSATILAPESVTVRVETNPALSAADTLTLQAGTVDGSFDLVIGGANGKNSIDLGNAAGLTSGGNDTLVLWGGFKEGTYSGTDAAGRDLSVRNDVNGDAAGTGLRMVNDAIDLGRGDSDTIVTYGAIDLTGVGAPTTGTVSTTALPGVEYLVAHSGLVITATQLAALQNLTFEGGGIHRLFIVGGGSSTVDLSQITVNGGTLLYIVDSGITTTGTIQGLGGTLSTAIDEPQDVVEADVLPTRIVNLSAGETVSGMEGFRTIFEGTFADLNQSILNGLPGNGDELRFTAAVLNGDCVGNGTGGDRYGAKLNNIKTIRLFDAANDLWIVEPTIEEVFGGSHTDKIYMHKSNGTLNVYLYDGDDHLTLGGAGHTGTIDGGAGNDTLVLLNNSDISNASLIGFERVEFESNTVSMTIAQINSVNHLEGTGELVVKGNAGTLTLGDLTPKVDFSAITGNLKVDVTGTVDYKITGGAGDDVFDFGLTFNADDSLDGGAGNDTLKLTMDTKNNTVYLGANVSNVEQVVLTGQGLFVNLDGWDPGVDATVDASGMGAGSFGIYAYSYAGAADLTLYGTKHETSYFVSRDNAGAGQITINLSGDGADYVVIANSTVDQSTNHVIINNFTFGGGGDEVGLGGLTHTPVETASGWIGNADRNKMYIFNSGAHTISTLADLIDGGLVEGIVSANMTSWSGGANNERFYLALFGNGTDSGKLGLYQVQVHDISAVSVFDTGNISVELLAVMNGADINTSIINNFIAA